ncbi:unnamed protein product [Albugo candida]|uniref:FYVE-type domain-containing protein n=3 Tax=Albugo candida TaxID=65357 RepID=A0A024GJX7_9STRA|nr:unnamed protein product [Albugo candida]|eukprot:CCI46817.1 unnamed protein product [Albugo candida]
MAKFCSNCGEPATGGKFCSHCGTKYDEQNSTSTIQMAASQAQSAFTAPKYKGHKDAMTSAFIKQATNGPNGAAIPMAKAIHSSFVNVNAPSQEKKHAKSFIPSAIPSAATGVEAQRCYEECVNTIRQANAQHNNENGVRLFKKNCKNYGSGLMNVSDFHSSIVQELGPHKTIEFIPLLARLVPDETRRRELVQFNDQMVDQGEMTQFDAFGSNSAPAFPAPAASERAMVVSGQTGPSKGVLKNRYADHPNCDICKIGFDVTKRRHQCRYCGQFVCNNCSPVRFLIPPGKQFENAKGYDPAVPQRTCIQCTAELQPLQEELIRKYAVSNTENLHEARGRFHAPYSNSLVKECQNAADIIGNFFRNEWGSSADRSIPITFLEKAHGIALMTIIKAGFLVTGKIGTGLVIAKLPNGSWSAPSAIGTIGLGGGLEIGGEIVEVMIILGSESAVKVFHKPQINLGGGLDLAVGPFGRSAEAVASASKSGLNANYSYSMSKGLYAGISLQGAVIASRTDINRKFYGQELQPQQILSGYVEQPTAAAPLYEALNKATQSITTHREQVLRRASIMGACRLCNCPSFVAHTRQVWNKECKVCKHVH